MSSDLEHQVSCLGHGDHLCMVYETPAEQVAAVVPFIRDGLKQNEVVAYITDEQTLQELSQDLEEKGIAVQNERACGSLVLLTKREAYLRGGTFDPQGMIRYLDETVRDALNRGFAGFRVTGQMSWALGCEPGCDRLIEYEALLNTYFPCSKALAICQYDRNRLSPRVIYDVLRTHPIAIIGNRVCTNLYYEPPELILGNAGLEHRVKWMLMQLERAHDAEQKIRKWNQSLEQSVRERTASLKESRDEMEAFAHSVSHDLRSPLRGILGYVDALTEDYGAEFSCEVAHFFGKIKASASRMDQLITDLLAYSKVARIDLVTSAIPIEVPLQNAIAELEGKNVDISILEPLPTVRGGSTLLQQVFRNLLNNAIKFVPPGIKPKVTVEAEALNGRYRIWVRDNGIGIPETHVGKLFQLFYRVGDGGFPGTGTGLAIVRRAVERLGGSVGVESRVGVGSSFWIELPNA